MGTNLTFQAQDAAVELDDHSVTIVYSTPYRDDAADGDGGARPVVIPRPDITATELKPASLLSYGRLVITTGSGQTHTIEFPRDATETFTTLQAIIRP